MSKLYMSHCVFPVPDIKETAGYYCDCLGFNAVNYLNAKEPHVCLYRDNTEVILLDSGGRKAKPNRELYGYGYDAYFITDKQQELQDEFQAKGVNDMQFRLLRNREMT